MPNIISIHAINQPELDVYARLTENQLRNRLEPEKGIFIAQTPKVIALALENGYEPLSILAEEGQLEGEAKDILEAVGETPIYTASRALLAELTGYSLTRGILCAMRRPRLPSLEAICAGARRIAVLDGVVDATNVGAIIRSAAALDMDAVLVTSTCCAQPPCGAGEHGHRVSDSLDPDGVGKLDRGASRPGLSDGSNGPAEGFAGY